MKRPLTIYYGDTFKGKIVEGAVILHGHHSYNWPNTKDGPNADVDTVFSMVWTYDGWVCEAVGFGLPPCYGNGAITVFDEENTILMSQ